MIYYTGDIHGQEYEIERFCKKFKPKVEDVIVILGDVGANYSLDERDAKLKKALNRVKPTILCIHGNHDRFLHNAKAKDALAGIKDYDDICVTLEDGTTKRVILSHYFTPMYNGHRYQAIHLHAHSHFTDEADFEVDFANYLNSIGCKNEIYNVGCMYWNYEPVTLDEIIACGRTVRPNYGESSSEYNVRYPWENQLVSKSDDITWNVFYHDCNGHKIDTFNIFEHGSFREYMRKATKKCQTKEKFAKELRSELMYYFWSKCEWEVLISPWVSQRDNQDKKVDVCWQVMNNWDAFLDYVWNNRKKL